MSWINKELFTEDFPKELLEIDNWISWKLIPDPDPDVKPRKVPVQADGTFASSTDPSTWTNYGEVKNFEKKGFVFEKKSSIVFIDLDNCILDNGKLKEWAENIVRRVNSYTEYSPSKKGLHIICKANLPEVGGNKKGDFEIYDNKRFATMTGDVYENYKSMDAKQDVVNEIHQEYFPNKYKEQVSKLPTGEVSELEDDEILEIISNAKNSERVLSLYAGNWEGWKYSSHSEADSALVYDLAFYTKDPIQLDRMFRSSGLYRKKWDRLGGDIITNALRDVTEQYTPKKENNEDGGTESEEIEREEVISYPKPIPLSDIMQMEFPPMEYVVQDLIPQGLILIMAAEKIGKSSMMRQIGYSVSANTKCLGDYESGVNGTVLYLSFEDTSRRVKAVMNKILDGADFPKEYLFQYEWGRIGCGCCRMLEHYLVDFPDTKLIMIDTWSYIRSKANGNQSFGNYQEDVEDFNKLRQICNKYGISIIISTHTNKGNHEDWTRNVHGGVGQTATVDTVVFLERERSTTQGAFHITGKDIEEKSISSNFKDQMWELVESTKRFQNSPTEKEIWDAFCKIKNEEKTPKEMAIALYGNCSEDDFKKDYNRLKSAMRRMKGTSQKLKQGEAAGTYKMFSKDYKYYYRMWEIEQNNLSEDDKLQF